MPSLPLAHSAAVKPLLHPADQLLTLSEVAAIAGIGKGRLPSWWKPARDRERHGLAPRRGSWCGVGMWRRGWRENGGGNLKLWPCSDVRLKPAHK